MTPISKFCSAIPNLELIFRFLSKDEKTDFSGVCKIFHKFVNDKKHQIIFSILSSGGLPLFKPLLNRISLVADQTARLGVLDLQTGRTSSVFQIVGDTQIDKCANNLRLIKETTQMKIWITGNNKVKLYVEQDTYQCRLKNAFGKKNQTVIGVQVNSDATLGYCLFFDDSLYSQPYTFLTWNFTSLTAEQTQLSIDAAFKILSMQITPDEKHALFACENEQILILDLKTKSLKYQTAVYIDLIPDGEKSAAFNIGVELYNIRKELEGPQNSPALAMKKIDKLPDSISNIVYEKLHEIRRVRIDFSKIKPQEIFAIFKTPYSSKEIIRAIDQVIEHFKLDASHLHQMNVKKASSEVNPTPPGVPEDRPDLWGEAPLELPEDRLDLRSKAPLGVPEDRYDLWARTPPKTNSSCSLL